MVKETLIDDRIISKLWDVLVDAGKKFKPSELNRLEEAFYMVSGQKEKKYSSNPWQRPTFYFPGLTARPWHDPSSFKAVCTLETYSGVIKAELLELLNKNEGFQPYMESFLLRSGAWNASYIKLGQLKFEKNWSLCPETTKIVLSLPNLGEMALFSALDPGTHIKPHHGQWNFRLTIHLGLIVPENCEFRVASEIRFWEEGKCLVFDDSFEHEVWNKGGHTRFCLLI